MTVKQRLDALDRRFKVGTRTVDEPRPLWVQLAPGCVLPAVVADLIAHALGSGSVAGSVAYVISFILLLLAGVTLIAMWRWDHEHRIRQPSA